MRIAAVIAAAGLSSRMGCFKPLLPFGARCAVERVIDAFVEAGVRPVVVVGGHRFDELAQVVSRTPARCTYNSDYPRGMFCSFKHGFGVLPETIEAVFAHPADIPLISAGLVRAMIAAFEDRPGALIYPRYEGQVGRPVLIPADLLPAIAAADEAGGLRVVLQAHAARAYYLEAPHAGILWDMDRIADYRRLSAIHSSLPL